MPRTSYRSSIRARATRSSNRATTSAAPGISFAIPESAPIPISTPSATSSPWTDEKAIADGPAIKAYINETAVENGIDKRIRYGHKVVRAEWSSDQAR